MTEKDLDDEGRRGLRWVEDHDIGAVGIYIGVGALLAELEACRPVVEAANNWRNTKARPGSEEWMHDALDLVDALDAYDKWKQERENG